MKEKNHGLIKHVVAEKEAKGGKPVVSAQAGLMIVNSLSSKAAPIVSRKPQKPPENNSSQSYHQVEQQPERTGRSRPGHGDCTCPRQTARQPFTCLGRDTSGQRPTAHF